MVESSDRDDSSRYEAPASGGRRTIRIEGRGADPLRIAGRERTGGPTRNRASHAAPAVPRAMGGSPDRLAMWAMLLGFLLVLVALLSSHF